MVKQNALPDMLGSRRGNGRAHGHRSRTSTSTVAPRRTLYMHHSVSLGQNDLSGSRLLSGRLGLEEPGQAEQTAQPVGALV
jgi:hypothetical protein